MAVELMANHNKKILFNLIDKCGTTTLRKTLPAYDYELIEIDKNLSNDTEFNTLKFNSSKYKKFCFIREPKSRYMVGLFQYLNFHINISLDELMSEIEENKIVFDSHTLPQNKFIINKFHEEDIVFIKFDSFSDSIVNIDGDIKVLPKLWSHIETDKGITMKLVKNIFDEFIDKSAFEEIYAKDFALYHSARDFI